MGDTLADSVKAETPTGFTKEWDINGENVTIGVKKIWIWKERFALDDNNEIFFEDISSSSRPVHPTKRNTKYNAKTTAESYGNGVFKRLDKVIKTISFIVSLGILLVFTAAAAVLVILKVKHKI